MVTNKTNISVKKGGNNKKSKKKIDKKKTVKQLIKSIKRKSTITKVKKISKAEVQKPIQLKPENEKRLIELNAIEADRESFITVWGTKLNTARKKIQDLNFQYRKILYKNLQDAYDVYDNVIRSEHCDDFFNELRGGLYEQGFKVQSNTKDSALIIRYVFGISTDTKTVSDYTRALEGAKYENIEPNQFAEWLERKTLTKVIEEQRAIKKEIETPAERLDRARRVVLRMIEIRETKPIIKHTTIEPNAQRIIGRHFGLCVMLGYAYRTFGRGEDSLNVDINLNLLIPPSIDLEITIIDKLARYIINDIEKYEKSISDAEEEQWAEDVWERIIASCDAEVEKNNEYWANRQQAGLADDQYEFYKQVKERKKLKLKKGLN